MAAQPLGSEGCPGASQTNRTPLRRPHLREDAEAMPWFVKLEEGMVDKAAFDAVVPEHLAWLAGLATAGHHPLSGYWADRKGRNGAGGMLLFEAGSLAEADALVRQDPLIRRGCVRWTLHEWRLVFGAVPLGEAAPPPALRSGTAAPDRNSADETPAPPG